MPPKIKIAKQDILDTAVNIVRRQGVQAMNVRNIAAALGCSTQPIFSNFASMEELKSAVVEQANRLCMEYIRRETAADLYPAYKASGMAYIRFAKEERELFKLLYMRDRTGETITDNDTLSTDMFALVENQTGLQNSTAKLFHLEMWAYVHGIATMFATNYLDLEWELVIKMITDAYQGLCKQYATE